MSSRPPPRAQERGSPDADAERPDPRRSLTRDLARLEHRRDANRAFWRSLGVLGTVGWSIALPAVAGALVGRALDAHLGSGIRFTLMLLTAGVLIGSAVAWHIVHRSSR